MTDRGLFLLYFTLRFGKIKIKLISIIYLEDVMTEKSKKNLFIFSVIFYIVTAGLMIWGTFCDLQIDEVLFNPDNKLSIIFEAFGESVAWILWGPIFTIMFVTRHDLNESLDILGRIIPAVHPIKNVSSGTYKFFNFVLYVITTLGFFVLSVIGYKKIIENVAKKFVDISQLWYFIICTVVAVAAVLIVKRIDKCTLNKLETVSLACLIMSLLVRICMEFKPITHRIRFREMVAASNGLFDEDGLSLGKLDKLTPRTSRTMLKGTDFSAYTPWYQKGNDMGIYSHPDSFPSGHTLSAACSFLGIFICFVSKKLEKLMPLAMGLSTAYVYLMGFTRMVQGAHYLTDVASGALIGYTMFLLTFALYDTFTKKSILPAKK